jgi:hypothetical protein
MPLIIVLLWRVEERGMGLELVLCWLDGGRVMAVVLILCWLAGGWGMTRPALAPSWLGDRLGEVEASRKMGVPEVEIAKMTVMTVRRVEDTMVELERERIGKIGWRRRDSAES